MALWFTPSEEQRVIGDAFANAVLASEVVNLGIDAGAGTGKSTTLIYLAERLRQLDGGKAKVTLTAFNRKAKLELDEKIAQVELGGTVYAKTYNGLGYSAFMKAKGIKDADRQALDLIKYGGIKYKRIARWLIDHHLPTDRRSNEQIADAAKALVRLFDLVRANTTYPHNAPASRRSLKLFMGGSLADADALVDYSLTDGNTIRAFLSRYGLFLDFAEDEDTIVRLVPEMYRVGQLAIDNPAETRRLFKNERWSNMLDGQRMWFDFTDQVHGTVVNQWRVWGSAYLFMDEAQDASPLDRALIDLHRWRQGDEVRGRVVMVGDPNQAIYAFRGADNEGFANTMRYLSIDRPLSLSVTRRCSKAIVRAAQQYKPDYQAFEKNAEGEVCKINPDDVAKLVKDGDALISRTKAPLFSARNRLMRAGVPAYIVGRDMSEPVINLLENVAEMDGFAWSRVGEYLDHYRDARISRMKERNRPEPDIEAFLDDVATVREILDVIDASSYDEAVQKIEHELNPENQPKGGVAVGTAHAMKGLEFQRVFIITPEKFPMTWMNQSPEELQQELNLTYVAITRGKTGVYMVEPGAPSYFDDAPHVEPDGTCAFMRENQLGARIGAEPFTPGDWLLIAKAAAAPVQITLIALPDPPPPSAAHDLSAFTDATLTLLQELSRWRIGGSMIKAHTDMVAFQTRAREILETLERVE